MNHRSSDAVRAALNGNDPSAEQLEIILAPPGPLSVVAAAGSGKTAVMAARIVHHIETGQLEPGQVLGITFTNKAARELGERISTALEVLGSDTPEVPTIQTYNAFANELVRIYGPRIGIDSDAALLSDAGKWQLIENTMDDLPDFQHLELRHPKSFVPQTISLAEACANHLVTPKEAIAACLELAEGLGGFEETSMRKRADLLECVQVYNRVKRQRRRIDFGDQVVLAVEILDRNPDVAKAYRDRYRLIMLDEYQDTNPAQKHMLKRIATSEHSVTAVGDARQAIYAWRGASMWNLLKFADDFPAPSGETPSLSLSTNYRCADNIVELSNRIIESVPEDRRGGSEVSGTGVQGEIHVRLFPDEFTEADWIADQCRVTHTDEGVAWSQIAVLVRSRRHAVAVVTALDAAGIPVETPDLEGLLAVPAVVDAIAWLHVIADSSPETNKWVGRILMGPRYRIHYRDLARVAKWGAEQAKELAAQRGEMEELLEADPGEINFSLLDALPRTDELQDVSDDGKSRVRDFLRHLADLRRLTTRPLPELLRSVIEETGLAGELASTPGDVAEAQLSDLSSFCALASEFDPAVGEPGLSDFLDYLELFESADQTLSQAVVAEAESVKVMTVHSAKGLEFDTVFIPWIAANQNLNYYEPKLKKDGQFPSSRINNPLSYTSELPPNIRADREYLPQFKGNKAQFKRESAARAMEDERRLFYVAVTRAQRKLCISCAWWCQPNRELGPSEFFDEVAAATDLHTSMELADKPPTNPLISFQNREWAWPVTMPARDEHDRRWADDIRRIRSGEIDAQEYLGADGASELEALLAGEAEMVEASSEEGPRGVAVTSAAKVVSGEATAADIHTPTPDTPFAATKAGSAIHAWLEDKLVSVTGLADEDDPTDFEGVDPAHTDAWLKSGFAEREVAMIVGTSDPMVEVGINLKLNGALLRGRVDAVFTMDGGFEVVDFKSGRIPDEPDWTQLKVYAEALHASGAVTGKIRLTYLWLKDGTTSSIDYEPLGVERFAEQFDPEGRLSALTR